MAHVCSGCKADITDVLFMECCNKNCKKLYDLDCLGITIEQINMEDKSKWICPECLSSTHNQLRNENTPARRVSGLETSFTGSSNVNTQRGSRLKTSEIQAPKSRQEHSVLDEIRAFRLEVLMHLEKQANAVKRIEEVCYNTKMELRLLCDVNKKVLEDKVATIDTLHDELQTLKARNQQLGNIINTPKVLQTMETSSLENMPAEAITVQTTKNVQNTNTTNTMTNTHNMIKSNVATKSAPTVRAEISVRTSECSLQNRTNIHEMVSDIKGSLEDESTVEASGWTTVQRKKVKFQEKNVKRGKNSNILDLQAMERKKHLHVWRLHPDTTVDMLKAHINKFCGIVTMNIEKIKHKTVRDYASFIIGVTEEMYHKICEPEMWPVNAEFGEWIWFRKSTRKGESGK